MKSEDQAKQTLRRYVDRLIALEDRINESVNPESEYEGVSYIEILDDADESPLASPLSIDYVYENSAGKDFREIRCVALEYVCEYGGPGVVVRFDGRGVRVTVTTMGVEIFHTLLLTSISGYMEYLIEEATAEIRYAIGTRS
jgi:hypothetical protein